MAKQQLQEIESVSNEQLGVRVEHLQKEIEKLYRKVSTQGRALGRVERKVFNGFGERMDAMNIRIDTVEMKIDAHKRDNDAAHTEFRKVQGGAIKFGATALVMIFIAVLTILGTMLVNNRNTEMPTNAPVVTDTTAD